MKYTYQIRKYFSMAAAAVLSACLLFGCTRADVSSSSQNASVKTGSTGQSTVNGGSSDNSLAGAGSAAGQSSQTLQQEQPAPAQEQAVSAPDQNTAPPAPQTAQSVSGTTTQNTAPAAANTAQQAQTDTPQPQLPEEDEDDVPDAYEWADPDAMEAFSGEYEKSDGDETVVIALVNDNQISFQFSTSQIGSVAQVSGNTAVYRGEDGYSIIFDISGDTLGVTVDGEDGDRSPMNGIYYRVLDGGDDLPEEEEYDDEDMEEDDPDEESFYDEDEDVDDDSEE